MSVDTREHRVSVVILTRNRRDEVLASIARARALSAQGADYLAFGAFFPSPTKPGARRASPELLRDSAGLGLPRVAIGGITPDNAHALVAAGADLLAVVSGVFDAADPVAAARAYLSCFEDHHA